MRFCFVSTQKNVGGGEVLTSSVAGHLLRGGHSVSWIVRGESEVEQRCNAIGMEVLHRLTGRGQNLSDVFAVRRALRRWAPDVVLMNDTHAVPIMGAAIWALPGRRPLRLAMKHTVFPLRSRLKYQLLTDQIICVSKAAQATVVRGGVPERKTSVIYGGSEVPKPEANAARQIRAELGLEQEQSLIASVGNLLDCKGHIDLVRAMGKLGSDSNAVAVIAGEGAERHALEGQIDALGLQGTVRLLGFRDDVEQLLQAADLVVHPSHAEGLSLALIQAQMLSRPIVATAVGGASEVLAADDAELCSSWLARPADPASLAAEIHAALNTIRNPTLRGQLNAKLEVTCQRAHRLFSVAVNSRQLADLVAGLL